MADETKHTPGPWTVVQDEWLTKESRARAVATWVSRREALDLFSVFAPDGSSVLVGDKANATLIAAAPDMLEALKRLVLMGEDLAMSDGCHDPRCTRAAGDVRCDPGCRFALARAAIAKAKP